MSITNTLHTLATFPWPMIVAAIVVLAIAIGGRTFIADARSALTNWAVAKIAAKTGTRPDVASGLVNGIKSVPGVIRGNKFFVFLVLNAIIAILISVMVARYQHDHPPTPSVSPSPSSSS